MDSIEVVQRALEIASRRKKWNQSRLALELGVEPQLVTNWKRRGLPANWFRPVAKVLDVTIEQLVGDEPMVLDLAGPSSVGGTHDANKHEAQPWPYKRIPVLGTAKLGDLDFYEDVSSMAGAGDGHIELATRDPDAYCLRVRGQSMFPVIRDGWYVLIEPNAPPREGEYVLLKLVDGRKMVKEFMYRREGSIEVMSVNGGARITFETAEIEEMHPVGAVLPPSKWAPS